MQKREKRILEYFLKNKKILERLLRQDRPSVVRIHKMRVAVRRLRAVIWMKRQEVDLPALRYGDQSLKKLAKALGPTRELQVALVDAREMRMDTVGLREKLSKAITKSMVYLHSPRQIGLLMERLERLQRALEVTSVSRARKVNRRLRKDVNKAFKNTTRDIHPLRICVKRVRYCFEAEGLQTGGLADLQGTLGEIHDLEVLQRFVGTKKVIKNRVRKLRGQALRQAPKVLRFLRKEVLKARSLKQAPLRSHGD
ncbi:MAG: hypothetical protein C5B49_04795 [Bdellovibrio sp.]|nr:MAG: hypothetical protein C5B49_04795 [Bdellovibrio sp.]